MNRVRVRVNTLIRLMRGPLVDRREVDIDASELKDNCRYRGRSVLFRYRGITEFRE